MPSTRRSARLASSQNSSSPAKEESPRPAAGSKRKSETGSSPAPKRGKKDAPKEQKTIEETMDVDQPGPSTSKPEAEKPEQKSKEQTSSSSLKPADESKLSNGQKAEEEHKQVEEPRPTSGANTEQSKATSSDQNDTIKALSEEEEGQRHAEKSAENKTATTSTGPTTQDQDHSGQKSGGTTEQQVQDSKIQDSAEKQPTANKTEQPHTNGNAIEAHARDEETPSSIMEKGIIYFFFRGRVGIDNPSEVQDIARSYIVLRPLPHGAKLGDGPIGPSENKCRLLALPKKVLPTSGKDRFMTFVEKAHTSFPELKKSFLPADDYTTQTAGVRHSPAVTPIAEGVYAITTTGRENHLAYMLTIPASLGDVQKDMGLREQGSFVISCKNPQFPGPSYASLPQGPDFPKEILDEFRSLRWMPLQPKHLDYENAQFLLIGESSGIDKAFDVPEDKKDEKEDSAKVEMERLEGEDEIRVKHLKGDDTVFTDLGVSKKDYPSVPTTWEN